MLAFRSWLSALALSAACAAITPALAQQPLVEYADISERLFNSEDVADLDRAAKLTSAQRESIETLMHSAAAEARELLRAIDRRVAEKAEALDPLKDGHLDKYQEAMDQLEKDAWAERIACIHKIASIERKALADVRSTLTQEQDAKAWSEFERLRRRQVLCAGCRHGGVKTDPATLVRGAKLSAADTEAAAKILENYDVQVDDVLIERMHRMDEIREESDKEGHVLWFSHRLHPARFRQLNIRTAQAIENVLSPEGSEKFIRYRIGVDYDLFKKASQNDRIRKITSLESLTDDQRTRITEMVDQADARLYRMAVDMMRACDREYLRADLIAEEESYIEAVYATMAGKRPEPFPPNPRRWFTAMDDTKEEARKLVDDLMKRVRAILTPEQRDEALIGKPPAAESFSAGREDEKQSEWSTPTAPAKGK
jgi:hypothetical protein